MGKAIQPLFFSVLLALAFPAHGEDLNLVVPEYLPFTGLVHGQPGGMGFYMVEGVLKEAGLTMKVHVVPNYSRCVSEVQSQGSDGFFLGSRNAERDGVAVMSEPLLLNNWVWVTPVTSALGPGDPDFKTKIRVGVILNTNPHVWLKDRGYTIGGTPVTGAALLAMLDARRFDIAFVPELVFKEALKDAGKKLEDYRLILQVRQPMGIYISKVYLSRHPGIMDKLNAAIRRLYPKLN